jgi:hypothetical protein
MKFGTDQTAAFDLSSLKVRRISSHHLQCCGSGMFISDLTFSIPDPGSKIFRPQIRIRISTQKIVSKLSEI